MLYSTTVEIRNRATAEKKVERSRKPTPSPAPTPEPEPVYNESLWHRFKNKIESIGEWFASDESDEKMAVIFYVLALIIYVGSIILAWTGDGFFSALITAIVGFFILGIAYYAITIVCMVLKWVLRLIFYNVWTFLGFLLLLLL